MSLDRHDMNRNIERLRERIQHLDIYLHAVCEIAISDLRFQEAPGGATRHHQYPGGLAEHTLEVLKEAQSMAADDFDWQVVTVAAIWHDFCKIYEYDWEAGTQEVIKLPYRKLIGHVVGSWREFMMHAGAIEPNKVNAISHAMLAHHGRHEWRSPVEPQTRAAHILHVADMLSMQKQGGEEKE